jgi:hypothetical protein
LGKLQDFNIIKGKVLILELAMDLIIGEGILFSDLFGLT